MIPHVGAKDGRRGRIFSAVMCIAALAGALGSATASAAPVAGPLPDAIVAAAATPDGSALWTVSDGGVVAGTVGAHVYGRLPYGMHPVGIASTADGRGYWIATASGQVFGFGDAQRYGDVARFPLSAPIVGIAATAHGYYLAGADGGVFAFGDARYHGSLGGLHLNRAVVSVAATARGYVLAGADGGVFTFGGVAYHGSLGGRHLNGRVVSIAAVADGYRMVGADGGVFDFGRASFFGSVHTPAVAIVSAPDGYWVASADGEIARFTSAPTAQLVPLESPYHGPHTYLARVGTLPVRWDPCRGPIRVGWSFGGRPLSWTLVTAVVKLQAATGLRFVFVGDAPSDITVVARPFDGAWGSTDVSAAWNHSHTARYITHATVSINATRPLNPGWTSYGSVGPLLLHELGHAAGLNHVYASDEAMNPDSRLLDYGPGDREGLWHLGARAGCAIP
jgi:hypothetical protein